MNWHAVAEIDNLVSRPIEEILKSRKVKDIDKFLYPELAHLYDPEYDALVMKDMATAVTRVTRALDEYEPIMICGDYDADGVTSTSVLIMGLEELDANVIYDIPDRKDGYGLSKRAVDKAVGKGVTLIITCDNGIAANEAVDYANKKGIDVVITDHHEPQEVLPNALAIVNPKQSDCPYPFKELAGCGVVFKFLQALHAYVTGDVKKAEKYLEIVAIGTVADVMELIGENRLLVKYGLEKMPITKNKGLKALLRILRLDDKDEITVKDIGWSIAPVLNAIGRLYTADEAVEMLTSESKRQAWRYAKRLDKVNRERQLLTEQWSKKIIKHIDDDPDLIHMDVMIIPFPEPIPEGLVGLIAGKLKERYTRPVILLTDDHNDKTRYKGSGRSIPAWDMFESVSEHKHLLIHFGGHKAACGLSIAKKDVQAFSDALNDDFDVDPDELVPKLYIDYEIEPELVCDDFIEELEMLEPFGKGNEKPLFMLKDVYVQYPKAIGAKQNHLKFTAQSNDEEFGVVGWSMHEKWVAMGKPTSVDIAFYPSFNEWNGRRSIQLELKDIKETD